MHGLSLNDLSSQYLSRLQNPPPPENKVLGKDNNSCKGRSSMTKIKLAVYYVKTNTYTKYQVNISNLHFS